MNAAAVPSDAGMGPPLWVAGAAAFALLFLFLALGLHRRLRPGLLVAIAATFVGLGMAETGAWLWVVAEYGKPATMGQADVSLPAGILVPRGVLPAPGRLPGVRGPKPRVLFMGDSFTEGLGVPQTATFAALIGRDLDVEVINHGITGTDLEEQRLRWQYYSRTWEPDVLVWVFVLNDFLPPIPLGPDYLMRVDPRPKHGSYLLAMVQLVLARRAVQAQTIAGYRESLDPSRNPEGFALLESTLQEAHADVSAYGGRLVFVIFPLMWDLGRYPFTAGHDHLVAAARRAGAEVVDLLPAFRQEHATDLWVSNFDHHPNERGHALAVRPLADALRIAPLVVMPVPRAPPTPAQWLRDAQLLYDRRDANRHGLRNCVVLAAAAALLAELEGQADNPDFSDQAWSFARHCQSTLDDLWLSRPSHKGTQLLRRLDDK